MDYSINAVNTIGWSPEKKFDGALPQTHAKRNASWINGSWCMHTMKYQVAVGMSEPWLQATWMNIKDSAQGCIIQG